MISHYLIIAWRNLQRHRLFSFLNLASLTIGLSFALLIFLWVYDEWKMDRFHERGADLYQVLQQYPTPEGIEVVDWTPALLAQKLVEELPEVEFATATKTGPFAKGIVANGVKSFRADGKLVSSDFFKVFSYPLLQGNPEQILRDKYEVVISETLATKLFGSVESSLGQTIQWEKTGFYDYKDNFTVGGVFANVPAHSSDQFDLLFNASYYLDQDKVGSYNWGNNPMATTVILRSGADPKTLGDQITQLIKTKNNQVENTFFLALYSKQYLHGNYENGVQAGGRIAYVRLFSLIAVIILLIASINFMNLSTARAMHRAKEIGVKKTMGAHRQVLIGQFVSESLFLAGLALLLSTLLVQLLLPAFNEITGKLLKLEFDPRIVAAFLLITVFTGLLSSTYPALYLSGFRPISILRGSIKNSLREVWIRKGLVVFQFGVSAVLIVSVLVIYQQMEYIQSKNLGYDRDHILRITKEGALKDKLELFLTDLRKIPGVEYASHSNVELIGNNNFSTIVDWEGKADEDAILVNVFETNYDFIETFSIGMEEGRTFSREYGNDTSNVILNQAAVKGMGLTDPIGKTITFWGKPRQIVGVTNNFQYQSLYNEVEPCLFKLFDARARYGDEIWVKTDGEDLVSTLAAIQSSYQGLNPGYPFVFRFVEDDYQALYESESRVAVIARYFTFMVIFISCLGLFGLAAFTVQKRRKEIGIRKVIGASAEQIALLLSKDFMTLVLLAIVVALPLAWYGMGTWLRNFTYRIELSWQLFALAAFLTVVISLLTVLLQSVRTALSNPVDSLRNE